MYMDGIKADLLDLQQDPTLMHGEVMWNELKKLYIALSPSMSLKELYVIVKYLL